LRSCPVHVFDDKLDAVPVTQTLLVSWLGITLAARTFAQETPPLRLVTKILVPGMTGTWDHLTSDPIGKRMFAAAQDDHVVWVFDLKTNQPIQAIKADFNRPQGMYYTPGGLLMVSNGRDGTLKVVDGHSFSLVKTIPLTLGADMMDFDPATKLLFVDHGGKDSNRGPGGLAVIDTTKLQQVGDIVTDWRPAALELEAGGPRLFVTLPGASEVAVIDRHTRQFAAHFPLGIPARPVALALDEKHHRVFVGTRSPEKFMALDADSGKTVATLDCIGGISGMFFDAKHQRVYVSGLDGVVEVFQQDGPTRYRSLGRITLIPKAATSLFEPSLNRYYVGAPPLDGQPGQIWVFEPLP
jgi:DNA-binding beta-propeller fold protein YncE